MVEYKHIENNAVRMTFVPDSESDKIKKEGGLKIKTEYGEFTFFPTNVIEDPVGDPILYFKFNHKESLVLYFLAQHPESRQALETLKKVIMIANLAKGENYIVRNIIDYIEEIEKEIEKLGKKGERYDQELARKG